MAPISDGARVETRPGGQVEPATVTCGICGFVMNDGGECASPKVTVRCKLEIAEQARTVTPDAIVDTGEDRDVASPAGDGDQVADWLERSAGEAGAAE